MDAQVQQVLNAISEIPQQYQKQVMKLMQDYRAFTDEQCIQLNAMQQAVSKATKIATKVAQQQQQQPKPKVAQQQQQQPNKKYSRTTDFTLKYICNTFFLKEVEQVQQLQCLTPQLQQGWEDKGDQPYTYDLTKKIYIYPKVVKNDDGYHCEEVQMKLTLKDGNEIVYRLYTTINKNKHIGWHCKIVSTTEQQ